MQVAYLRMPRTGSAYLSKIFKKHKVEIINGKHLGYWKSSTEGIANLVHNYTLLRCDKSNPYKTSYKEKLIKLYGVQFVSLTFFITSVRNPFSRAVSIYHHQSWRGYSFPKFLQSLHKRKYPSSCAKWHSTTISSHLKTLDTKVNYIVKLESIDRDLNKLGRILNKNLNDYSGIKIDNSARRERKKSLFSYYNKREYVDIVQELYANDFLEYGYSTELERYNE